MNRLALICSLFVAVSLVACILLLDYQVVTLQHKVSALERVDTVTGETVAEMLTLIEMVIDRINEKKHPAGYQSIGNAVRVEGPPLCVVHENNTERYVSCDEAWLIRKDAEPPCLAQMEAAMRAMEPIILTHDSTIEQLRDAIRLWDLTKRECWRQP